MYGAAEAPLGLPVNIARLFHFPYRQYKTRAGMAEDLQLSPRKRIKLSETAHAEVVSNGEAHSASRATNSTTTTTTDEMAGNIAAMEDEGQREREVGITHFRTMDTPGFSGILKKR